MLEVFIGNQAVDLPPDINLTITAENPIFTEDRIPMPYTYPNEFGKSPRNLAIWNHPERLMSSEVPDELPCRIRFDGQYIDDGSYVLEETGETLSGYFKGIETNPNFEKPLNELILDFSDEGSKLEDVFCMDADRYDNKNVVFAPIKLFGAIERGGDLVTWKNYINYYVANGHFLRDIFPAIRVGWLLDQIFGPALETNPFREEAYRNVVVQTLCNKGYSYPNNSTYTSLQDYLPSVEAKNFVLEVLKLFCCSVTVKRNKYHIIFNRDVMATNKVVDWSDKLITPYTPIREKGQYYKYGYNDAKKITPGAGLQYVQDTVALLNRESETAPDSQQIKVRDTGQIIDRVRNYDQESRWKYDVLESGFGADMDKQKEGYDATCDLRPMDMTWNKILLASDDPGYEKYSIFCPQIDLSELGSDEMPRIMLWHGRIGVSTFNFYPYLSSYNFYKEAKLSSFSLRWDGSDGLIAKFHKDFKAWIEKNKIRLKCYMLLSTVDLSDIDWTRKYYIEGKNFLLKSYSVPLAKDKILPAEMEFIEA